MLQVEVREVPKPPKEPEAPKAPEVPEVPELPKAPQGPMGQGRFGTFVALVVLAPPALLPAAVPLTTPSGINEVTRNKGCLNYKSKRQIMEDQMRHPLHSIFMDL